MNNERVNFDELVARAMAQPGRAAMRPVIEKELLHLDILFALERERLLDQLTFQGGTSLRLCQGSPRFSEDLDFAGDWNFCSQDLSRIRECIEDYVSKRYQLEVSVKEPKELREEPGYRDIRVDKWQVSVVTAPARKDIPKQRIKLEVASLPAYTREAHAIQVHYPFLPDGYNDLLIMTESLEEVMADKLISLVNTKKYVRHRDIWDLAWLKQQGASPDVELVKRKIQDYTIEHYPDRARDMQSRLAGIVSGTTFQGEMARFLPTETVDRTIRNPRFADFLTREITAMLEQVITTLEGPAPGSSSPEFTL
ncbi:nucleotidyl transferase AbiEii/AbiGii toxin family protein [Chromohalobacter beijerinckii]|uniref:Nucleotidyl transferase AbiEii/AbiGii toxin family protein n=1 Tax=Chromohalobacter beijerinckii TaxID=86179 RepID=A0ABV8X8B2_9GAMM|nr:nucleotidyl transferase AbiEii/AbiGii toxin family protein [Chromohalobacter beijerinckii]MCK0766360.1 nucleotidyl transferase AbiEii/AbiGii toxin family protein [Chromohalobacter beijerinckii]